jgi:hypothetical protein
VSVLVFPTTPIILVIAMGLVGDMQQLAGWGDQGSSFAASTTL